MNMIRSFKRIAATAMALCLAWTMLQPFAVMAEDDMPELISEGTEVKQIFNYEDLLTIRDNPSGSYELMCDIDMAGIVWEPVDFSGVFDGNDYAILNCTVTSVTSDTRLTYDGNMIDYDTVFSGFFGIVEGATITDFSLLGINVDVDVDADCFVGGLCGYTDETVIRNCTVEGTVSLYVNGAMFGVGGAIGFGSGEITGSTIDTTLVCVDKNAEEKDEQFMGGVNGNGYLSIDSCNVTIRGYDSDHGYVHDGGLSGMFILYPEGYYYWGFITNNTVNGYITFFEDNEDRRAYCEPDIGEDMTETHDTDGNEYDFERDERFEYDVDLFPETCENPEYTTEIVAAACPEYGYTLYTCTGCGYSFKADYTAPAHNVLNWNVLQAATEEAEGLGEGVCQTCGKTVYQVLPKAEPTSETTEPQSETVSDTASETTAAPETTTAADTQQGRSIGGVVLVVGIVVLVVAVALLIIVLTVKEKRRKARIRARKLRQQQRRQNR